MSFISASARAGWVKWAIDGKAETVVFTPPDDVPLAPQSLRIEYDNVASDTTTDSGMAGMRRLTIFGVHDSPDLPDSDIGPGYRFVFDDREYTVVDVIRTIGELQARAEAVG